MITIYEISVRSYDLCGGSVSKHVGYSMKKLPELDYAFYKLIQNPIKIEDPQILKERAVYLVENADWRG